MDKGRIISMTQFAIYDKRFGRQDQKMNEYFENDYIYVKNSWTRFFVFIGCMLIAACRWLLIIYAVDGDFFAVDFRSELMKDGVYIGASLVVYTLISSRIAFREYNRAKVRVKNYYAMLARLGNAADCAEEDIENGTTAYISRNAD